MIRTAMKGKMNHFRLTAIGAAVLASIGLHLYARGSNNVGPRGTRRDSRQI